MDNQATVQTLLTKTLHQIGKIESEFSDSVISAQVCDTLEYKKRSGSVLSSDNFSSVCEQVFDPLHKSNIILNINKPSQQNEQMSPTKKSMLEIMEQAGRKTTYLPVTREPPDKNASFFNKYRFIIGY